MRRRSLPRTSLPAYGRGLPRRRPALPPARPPRRPRGTLRADRGYPRAAEEPRHARRSLRGSSAVHTPSLKLVVVGQPGSVRGRSSTPTVWRNSASSKTRNSPTSIAEPPRSPTPRGSRASACRSSRRWPAACRSSARPILRSTRPVETPRSARDRRMRTSSQQRSSMRFARGRTLRWDAPRRPRSRGRRAGNRSCAGIACMAGSRRRQAAQSLAEYVNAADRASGRASQWWRTATGPFPRVGAKTENSSQRSSSWYTSVPCFAVTPTVSTNLP